MSHGPSKLVLVVLVVLVVIEPPGFKLNTNDLYSNAITFVFSPAITNMEEEIDTVTSGKSRNADMYTSTRSGCHIWS